MRAYRRLGVGKTAANRLFDLYAGVWEVRVIEENLNAMFFWRKTIDAFTGNEYKEEEIDDPDESGTVFRLKSVE
jgi:predicted acetyltransferase